MILQKYASYIDSGVEWLGEIPESWEIKRVKEIFYNFGSGSTPKAGNPYYYEDSNINWLNTADLNNSEVYETKQKVTEFAVKDYSLRVFPKDSIAMGMYGQGKTRGMVGLLKIQTTTNQASCIMSGIKKGYVRFILWSLISKYDVIRSINTGTTQPNMNQDFIRNTCLIIPSQSEQISISNFLDEKTSQIDSKIKKLQEKIISYDDLKKSLINETVCRGLNKDIELKDSEIEWIGNIPKHWNSERGKDKFFYDKCINKGLISKNVLSLTYGGVINKDFDTTVGLNPGSYETYQFVNKNDLIFKLIDLENIKTSRVGIVHENGIMSSAYIRLNPKRNIHSRYYYYLYFFYYRINLFNYLGGGVRSTLGYSRLLEIPIISPQSKDEQIQIANYLDEKTTKIDDIISKIKNQVEALKEFRKTLINDVVTGKVRIQDERITFTR